MIILLFEEGGLKKRNVEKGEWGGGKVGLGKREGPRDCSISLVVKYEDDYNSFEEIPFYT